MRCRTHLVKMCEHDGFTPKLAHTTDDMVVMQALVAAGTGVATIPGLAFRAHRHPALTVTKLHTPDRQIYAAVFGELSDPPATRAMLDALSSAAKDLDRMDPR